MAGFLEVNTEQAKYVCISRTECRKISHHSERRYVMSEYQVVVCKRDRIVVDSR